MEMLEEMIRVQFGEEGGQEEIAGELRDESVQKILLPVTDYIDGNLRTCKIWFDVNSQHILQKNPVTLSKDQWRCPSACFLSW